MAICLLTKYCLTLMLRKIAIVHKISDDKAGPGRRGAAQFPRSGNFMNYERSELSSDLVSQDCH